MDLQKRHPVRRHTTTFFQILLLGAMLSGMGCSTRQPGPADLTTQINQIRPGMPEATVKERLGSPQEIRRGVAGAQPTGPQPPVTIRAGSAYEQWIYRAGDSEYHVFLGPSTAHAGQPVVHAVSANPRRVSDEP